MSSDQNSSQPVSLARLRVTAEADPGVLARVLERFQNLNVVPRRVVAECSAHNVLRIEVDVAGVADDRLTLIVGKVAQATSVLSAFWHRA